MATKISVEVAIIEAKPPLKALADVKLMFADGEITIRRCAVFEKPDAPPWANLPRLRIETNGKKEFVPFLDLSRELKKRVLNTLLDEYRRKTEDR